MISSCFNISELYNTIATCININNSIITPRRSVDPQTSNLFTYNKMSVDLENYNEYFNENGNIWKTENKIYKRYTETLKLDPKKLKDRTQFNLYKKKIFQSLVDKITQRCSEDIIFGCDDFKGIFNRESITVIDSKSGTASMMLVQNNNKPNILTIYYDDYKYGTSDILSPTIIDGELHQKFHIIVSIHSNIEHERLHKDILFKNFIPDCYNETLLRYFNDITNIIKVSKSNNYNRYSHVDNFSLIYNTPLSNAEINDTLYNEYNYLSNTEYLKFSFREPDFLNRIISITE